MVRWIAFAGGAGDEQCTLAAGQQGGVDFVQTAHAHRHAGTTHASALRSARSRAKPVWLDQTSRIGAVSAEAASSRGRPRHHSAAQVSAYNAVASTAICDCRAGGAPCHQASPRCRRSNAEPISASRSRTRRCRARRVTAGCSCILLVEQALEGAAKELPRAVRCTLQVACSQASRSASAMPCSRPRTVSAVAQASACIASSATTVTAAATWRTGLPLRGSRLWLDLAIGLVLMPAIAGGGDRLAIQRQHPQWCFAVRVFFGCGFHQHAPGWPSGLRP